MTQRKQGIHTVIFPDRESTGNFPKNIKNTILHREFTCYTRSIWKIQKLNFAAEKHWENVENTGKNPEEFCLELSVATLIKH